MRAVGAVATLAGGNAAPTLDPCCLRGACLRGLGARRDRRRARQRRTRRPRSSTAPGHWGTSSSSFRPGRVPAREIPAVPTSSTGPTWWSASRRSRTRTRTATATRSRSGSTRPPRSRSSAASCAKAGALLVGAIARADERAREDRPEAERLTLLAEPAELVGVHPAVDPDMLGARLQVLADRDDVDPVRAQVAHRLDDLVVRLAEADDDAGLRHHRVVRQLLRAREQPQRLVVARLRAAHVRMEAADGLDVVIEDIRPFGE